MTVSVRFCLSCKAFKIGFYRLQTEHYFNKKRIVDTDVVNDLSCLSPSVITHVIIRSYDFCDDVIY